MRHAVAAAAVLAFLLPGLARADSIAFVSERDGNAELYTLDPVGGTVVRLTQTRWDEGDPAWAPDGRRLAFTRHAEIHLMLADTGQETALTADERCSSEQPAWSRDGSQLAFRRGHLRMSSIWTMRSDGTRQRALIGALSLDPDWSPVADDVVLTRDHFFDGSRENGELWIIGGSDARPVTGPRTSDFAPTWSPDGRTLAIESVRNGNRDVYVIDLDGNVIRRLTHHPARDGQPSWSPDGARVAFVSSRDGNEEIYVVNADGTGERRLTTSRGSDTSPDWRPPQTPGPPPPLPTGPKEGPSFCQYEQARSVTLRLSGHLRVSGSVRSEAFFHGCAERVPVLIQRRTSGWRTVARTVTVPAAHVGGRFTAVVPDRRGFYRAVVAPRRVVVPIPVGSRLCERAVSPVARHRH